MREKDADYILKVEGGFVDNPKDPGGRTNFGITAATLASSRARLKDAWLPEDVINLTKEQALSIYEKFYWKPAGCDHIPRPVDLALFDGCVNCGVRQGVKLLQEALNMLGENLAVDGIFGQKTMQAAWEHALPKTKNFIRPALATHEILQRHRRTKPRQAGLPARLAQPPSPTLELRCGMIYIII